MSDPLELGNRSGLPDALRVLAEQYPREVWETHRNFSEMVQFWMQRHMMFREVMRRIRQETELFLDGQSDLALYAPLLSKLGGFFLNELHMHHQIEDAHYFPQLTVLDARIADGFELLETDHVQIDGLLKDFAEKANAVLTPQAPDAAKTAAAAFLSSSTAFNGLLDRHLVDEEELVVPVVLETGFRG